MMMMMMGKIKTHGKNGQKSVEGKVVPMYVKKAYRGSEVIDPVFPNFGARWR